MSFSKLAVCTTIQYTSYKPSANSTAVTIMPQTTIGDTVLKSPEEMRDYMNEHTAVKTEMWNEFTWCPPFFKVHMKTSSSSLDMVSDSWLGILGGGVDTFRGLENLLVVIYDVPEEIMQSIYSIVISSITTAVVTFVAGMIATKLTQWSFWHIITLLIYSAIWIAIFAYTNSLDMYTARAALFAMGFALTGI